MNTLKGFISIPYLANNSLGQTAIFGELSTYSQTFSRIKQQFADPTSYPGIELVTFTTVTDTGSQFNPSVAVSGHILAVATWVYEQYQNSLIPSNASKAAFITALTTEFPLMTGVVINEILNGSPSTKRMPDYIYWHFNDGGVDNEIKIWFADSRFRTQYDDFEILVIPPVATLDTLNNPLTTVAQLVLQRTASVVIQAVNTLTNNEPYTILRTQNVVWNSPSSPGVTLPTDWTVVIYGAAGNDTDAIKSAIREYISTHSALTVWSTIYPSLYADNEFVIIPMWGDTSVPENGLDPGLYSASVRAGKLINVAAALIPSTYAQSVVISTFLSSHLYIASAFFRSLSFMAVGNPNNAGSAYSFDALYGDYMNIPTTSSDFARMVVTTQNFIIKLNDALEKAMTLTSISAVPVGYTRSIRNNKVYLTFDYNGYNYLVLAAISYSE